MAIIGLANIGNTCFMNSALQMILNCDDLNDAILKSKCNGTITETYKELLQKYRESDERETIVPIHIKKAVGMKHKIFSGLSQQDAHEFLAMLLACLEKEFKEFNEKDNTIGNFIDSKITITVKSKESDKISTHKELVSIIPLDLPNEDKDTSLEDCFSSYMSEQNIDEPVKFEVKTENNKKRISEESAVQQLTISKTSKYLLVHLKRFCQYGIGRFNKKNNKVNIQETIDTTQGIFHLKSFVVHMGSLNGGHYVAFVRDRGTWKCANDSRISEVPNNDITNPVSYAYMLCYEKEDK